MRKIASAVFAIFALAGSLLADAPQWQFAPPHLGGAIVGGGWMAQRTLGVVNASPEFTFPLQLVYLSVNTQRGMFGDQWFCPQLESYLLPRGKGQLLWRTPGGGLVLLTVSRVKDFMFADQDQQWQAKVVGIETQIWNTDRWSYVYRNGKLMSLTSPTGRVLEFGYKDAGVNQMVLRDLQGGGTRLLFQADYDSDHRVTALSVCGLVSRFGYEAARGGRLVAWQRTGASRPDVFAYGKMGELASIQPAAGDAVTFTTQFFSPANPNATQQDTAEEAKKPANYRLMDDGTYRYNYIANTISIASRTGVTESYDFNRQRGIATSTDPTGQHTQNLYYRAPGQKYNGKLRRVERDGVVLVENHYDKATGNLIDSTDKDGITTYFEYAPGWNKPVRIYRGNDKKKTLVAAFTYDGFGRVTAQTDELGRTAKISYNAKNEIESVTDASGNSVVLSHDGFGRVTGSYVADASGKPSKGQKVDYGDDGRVRSRTAPDGQVTEYAYDAAGNVSEVKQNGIMVTKYDRNEQGWPVAVTDALGRVTKFDYDAHGSLLAEHQPNGSTTKYQVPIRRTNAPRRSTGRATASPLLTINWAG